MIVIAAAAQVPLLGLAFVVEFSRRKARPLAARELPAVAPQPAAELAQDEPPAVRQTAAEQFADAATADPEVAEPEVAVAADLTSTRLIAPAPELPLEEPARVIAQAVAPEVALTPAVAFAAEPEPVAVAIEPAPPVAAEPPAEPAPRREPVRIGLGLRRTRENFLGRIRAALTGSAKIDEIYEALEEALIGADVGVETSLKIVAAVRARLKGDARPEVIRDALKDAIESLLLAVERPFADSGDAPLVILMAGVNGVGKTTTVAKLAAMFKAEQGTVVVAAADTFRAAAIEQLQIWCDRVGVDLIKQNPGSDPAAVAFDAVKAAIARKASALLIDTAGRMQTKTNLMEELKKISRVVGRELPGAPHETWLVLDATTGQNALSQAKVFGESATLTGVVLAKLDGTAKGGVVVAIAERLKLPVRFVGLGEGLEDLRPFDAREFVNALFSEAEESRATTSGTYAA